MKIEELAKKVEEINSKIAALGDIQVKSGEVEAVLQRVNGLSNQADQDIAATSQAKIDALTAKDESIRIRDEVVSKKNEVDQQKGAIDSVLQQVNEIVEKTKKNHEEAESINFIIRDQLGLVNAGILSNSFNAEAEKLESSVARQFILVTLVTIILLVVAVSIVWWEFSTTNNFLSAGFVLKLSLTTPLIFYLIFITKIYNREKRLLDEYRFKSTVAVSFEAYRKLIKEDGSQQDSQVKVIDFLIASINSLYTSPMENLYKHHLQDDDIDIDVLGKVAGVFKNFIK